MAAGADRSTETGPPAPAGESLVRLVPCAVPLEDASGRDRVALRRGAEIWVADDGSALTGELVDALKARGFVTRVIGRGEATSAPVPERLDGLVLLASAGDDAHVKEAFRLLHHTAPALRRAAQHGAAVLAAVTRLDGAFGFLECSPDVEPACGALAGLAKTAAHEWPEVSCKSIDVAPDWDDAARTIADELSYRGPVEVGLAPGRITTVELVPSSVPVGGANPTLAPGDVLVVTGGARGVTAEVALAFARAFRPTVVLLGRSPDPEPEPPWLAGLSAEAEIKRALATRANGHASPQAVGEQFRRVAANREIVRNLDRIQAAGARVVYRSVDVRDAAAVRACLAGLQSALGPVRGVVHGAGVLADRRIEDQSDEQFAQVYDTKVLGLRNILGALSDVPLKLLALFSSSTARFGRNGQVAYAAANEVLNKTAQREAVTRPGCRVVSVNWGPWDGGMVTDVLKPLFTSEGIGLIPLRAGAEYLVNELGTDSHDHAVEVVVLGPGSVIQPAAKPERRAAAAPELAQVFEREVTVESVPVLDSHVIDGRPVLPLALTLEWLAQGAAQRNPGLLFAGLGELRLLKGVVIRASQPETLRVLAGKAVRRDNVYAVPVELAGRFADGTEVAHARGEVLLAERHTTAKPSIGSLELPHFGTSVEEVYRDTLFHGPRLHGVERIEGCGESGIAATVATNPAPTQWIANPLRHAWLSDPLAIDCAFQLMVLWCAEVLGAGSLPTRLAGYSQFRKGFPAGGVRVAARVLQVSQHKAIAEIEFLDDQGGLVARIDEYECVIDASLNDAFRRNQAIPITPR